MLFGVLVVLSASAVYEIFEWLLTVVMAPQHAEAYNGQQGDLWDAQKDMALSFGGSLCACFVQLCYTCLFPGEYRSRQDPLPP